MDYHIKEKLESLKKRSPLFCLSIPITSITFTLCREKVNPATEADAMQPEPLIFNRFVVIFGIRTAKVQWSDGGGYIFDTAPDMF